jgi:hypothetical protein
MQIWGQWVSKNDPFIYEGTDSIRNVGTHGRRWPRLLSQRLAGPYMYIRRVCSGRGALVKADQILFRMIVHSGMKAGGPATKADQTLE